MNLGQIGIWRLHHHGTDGVAEIEQLGYSALWLGGSPSTDDARPYLEQTSAMTIATGILNVWQHDPAAVADGYAELDADFPGRFLLGIGIGHPEATSDYTHPLANMRAFFDGLDAVPTDRRIAAALGPKMLDLAAQRSLGAHTYFVPPEHAKVARERMGAGAVIATEVACVVETDAGTAREIAREYAKGYLARRNYTTNLLRLGYDADELKDGGSDRLIDAVIPHGSAAEIAETVRQHLDAGADHVCLQPLGPHPADDYKALAGVLL
jgi:probable F420-dependent oxidoreductase